MIRKEKKIGTNNSLSQNNFNPFININEPKNNLFGTIDNNKN